MKGTQQIASVQDMFSTALTRCLQPTIKGISLHQPRKHGTIFTISCHLLRFQSHKPTTSAIPNCHSAPHPRIEVQGRAASHVSSAALRIHWCAVWGWTRSQLAISEHSAWRQAEGVALLRQSTKPGMVLFGSRKLSPAWQTMSLFQLSFGLRKSYFAVCMLPLAT